MSTKKSSVEVAPAAVVAMMLHASNHVHEAVHGILLGKHDNDKISVTEAVPVCHGAPTHPLVEAALGLVEKLSENKQVVVVGWYVSPRLFDDDKPGPAALKIVSSLVTTNSDDKEPTLLVLQNKSLAKVWQDGDEKAVAESIQALGKDFGKQWLEPLNSSIASAGKKNTASLVQKGRNEKLQVMDLVDHFEADDPTIAKWYPNESLTRFVQEQTQ